MKTTKTRSTTNVSKSISSGLLSSVEPAIPANTCCGMLMRGNNGQVFESTKNLDGTCSWKKI